VSKKVAEGLDALVLDVKTGSGAFLPDRSSAEDLARLMIGLAARFGLRAEALVTAMDQPLGLAVGNALEVVEALEALRGAGPPDLEEVTIQLAVRLLEMTGTTPAGAGGRDTAHAARVALRDGSALERFRRLVEAQGGDPRVVDRPEILPRAPMRLEVRAARSGFVRSLAAREVGLLVVGLGGGRQRKTDAVDLRVGVVLDRKVGDEVRQGERLATVHAAASEAGEGAVRRLEALFEIGEERPQLPATVLARITG
jgi:pyrimidine-nucleoside phosphorylase